ncbi:MAG: hypothetical protein ACOYMG_26180, partial [Candidatus Methylumidiphilus sp.]
MSRQKAAQGRYYLIMASPDTQSPTVDRPTLNALAMALMLCPCARIDLASSRLSAFFASLATPDTTP